LMVFQPIFTLRPLRLPALMVSETPILVREISV
jgi:hypothetical protein